MHGEDPEGWNGEGGGRGDRDGEHIKKKKKASGGDEIPVELFQILEDDAVKVFVVLSMPAFGKRSSGHRAGKISFHSNPKER